MMNPVQLTINVSLYQQGMGGRIEFREELQLPDTDFLGMAAILSKFHALAEEIKSRVNK